MTHPKNFGQPTNQPKHLGKQQMPKTTNMTSVKSEAPTNPTSANDGQLESALESHPYWKVIFRWRSSNHKWWKCSAARQQSWGYWCDMGVSTFEHVLRNHHWKLIIGLWITPKWLVVSLGNLEISFLLLEVFLFEFPRGCSSGATMTSQTKERHLPKDCSTLKPKRIWKILSCRNGWRVALCAITYHESSFPQPQTTSW